MYPPRTRVLPALSLSLSLFYAQNIYLNAYSSLTVKNIQASPNIVHSSYNFQRSYIDSLHMRDFFKCVTAWFVQMRDSASCQTMSTHSVRFVAFKCEKPAVAWSQYSFLYIYIYIYISFAWSQYSFLCHLDSHCSDLPKLLRMTNSVNIWLHFTKNNV